MALFKHTIRFETDQDGNLIPIAEDIAMTPEEEAEFLANLPASVPAKVTEVTRAQAKIALDEAGLLDQVEAVVAAHPVRAVRIWYADAGVWDRDNPYVQALSVELGLTDEQVDALFEAASKK